MRVLIAPQEFKGSLTAEEAADAIAEGARAARPDWKLDLLPLSDGGPGFIDAMRRAMPSAMCAEAVHDALGRKVVGRYVTLRGDRSAVIEAAQANGLMHVAPAERDALHSDSYGVGELIASAIRSHPSRITVGVGGSATTDGGAGMARALGARFLDGAGNPLPPGGASLADLMRIEWVRPPEFAATEIIVATDVTNPLTGPDGAAAVYGPQKGATPEQVDLLEAALLRLASVARRHFNVDVANMAGAGAAGGLAAGLVLFLGARVESGFDWVARAANLPARLESADLVITGEGSFDSQSGQGKVTGRLLALAQDAGKPCLVFAGTSEQQLPKVHTLTSLEPDARVAMQQARALLSKLAAQELGTWKSGPGTTS